MDMPTLEIETYRPVAIAFCLLLHLFAVHGDYSSVRPIIQGRRQSGTRCRSGLSQLTVQETCEYCIIFSSGFFCVFICLWAPVHAQVLPIRPSYGSTQTRNTRLVPTIRRAKKVPFFLRPRTAVLPPSPSLSLRITNPQLSIPLCPEVPLPRIHEVRPYAFILARRPPDLMSLSPASSRCRLSLL